MDNTISLEIIEVVEQAAIASARWMGKGDKNTADEVAVEAMRERMNKIHMRGGTNLVAYGQNGSMAVLAISEKGGLFAAPDFYMNKLAAPAAAAGHVDIRKTPTENLRILSDCLDRAVEELVIVIMDRERHVDLIAEVRAAGARVRLISDGDVSAAISCAFEGTNIHALMGIGAAPEGVISAAALRCLGGHFQGQLIYDPAIAKTGLIGESKESNIARLQSMNINDPDKIYNANELASGANVLFAACGITTGTLMEGVRYFAGGARTESLIISSQSKTVRFVDTIHINEHTQRLSLN